MWPRVSNDSVHLACEHSRVDNPMFERRTPDMSTWRGREPQGFRCHNSFAAFVKQAKRSKEGKAHLERHHGGFTGHKED